LVRQNALLMESVLTIDWVGRKAATREMAEGWDVESMRRRQEALMPELGGDWVTAQRASDGVLELFREDF
jgi:hypothetical protein